MKWTVEPVKIATKTFYQAQRHTDTEVEKAGGCYERESIAQQLCDVLNAEEEDR